MFITYMLLWKPTRVNPDECERNQEHSAQSQWVTSHQVPNFPGLVLEV